MCRVTALAFVPGEPHEIASASSDASLRLWDAHTGEAKRQVRKTTPNIGSLVVCGCAHASQSSS